MHRCTCHFVFTWTGCYRRLVRLVGGHVPNEGRLEVYYKRRWGTVCQRGFDIRDANVACRQLGYSQAVSVRYNSYRYYGHSRGPIYLDNIQCRGSEQSLFHCGHRGIGVHSCSHRHDVGVVCYKPGRNMRYCDHRYRGNLNGK